MYFKTHCLAVGLSVLQKLFFDFIEVHETFGLADALSILKKSQCLQARETYRTTGMEIVVLAPRSNDWPRFCVAKTVLILYNSVAMRMENYSSAKFKKEMLRIIGKHLDLAKHKVFIFGSRISGRGDDRSDIDIGIDGKAKIPLATVAKIREEVEGLPILYEVDIVDFQRVEPDFKKVAMAKIEKLN